VDSQSHALREMFLRERIFRWSLAAADALAAMLAVFVALTGLGHHEVHWVFLLVTPLMVLAAKIAGLYDKDECVIDHSTLNELPRLLNLAGMFALLVWLVRHYIATGDPRTVDLLMLWLLLVGGLVMGRSIARRLAARYAPIERCLLVGGLEASDRLERKLERYPRVRLVKRVATDQIALDHCLLRTIAERDQIQRIIVDIGDHASAAVTPEVVRAANATGLRVSLLPNLVAAVGGAVVFDDVDGMALMGVPRFGLSHSSRLLKRSLDVVAASAGVICAAPLMAFVAIAIKLDSSGAVLFRQTRVGRDSRPFTMLKFRTMVDGADALKDGLRAHNEADGLFKIAGDPRITRVGGFLRRTGIDELPQLLNVLCGDMSLVGPRPLVVDEDARVTGFDRQRLHLTPGLTGRWQTLGAARVPLSEMVKIDYLYIASWSLWTDFKIIIQTIGYVARGRGQ
jgi:exopolysaccharide biosynthesis polyprenyl glycosylphosphotransferase